MNSVALDDSSSVQEPACSIQGANGAIVWNDSLCQTVLHFSQTQTSVNRKVGTNNHIHTKASWFIVLAQHCQHFYFWSHLRVKKPSSESFVLDIIYASFLLYEHLDVTLFLVDCSTTSLGALVVIYLKLQRILELPSLLAFVICNNCSSIYQ
jgi:hypothetical protein